MKTFRILLVLLNIGFAGTLFARGEETATFKVWGNCESCKSRIEKAAKSAGAATAEWHDETNQMEVTFNSTKTSADTIQQKIAAAGHDTEKYKTLSAVYDKLPGCCKYERASTAPPGQ